MSHDCHTLRERLFDARRGDLSDIDAALMEDDLAQCSECTRYAERMGDLLDLHSNATPEVWLPALDDAGFEDRLFGAIESALEDSLPLPSDEDIQPQRPRRWIAVAALAAAVLLVVLVGIAIQSGPTPPSSAPTSAPPSMARASESTPSLGLFASTDAEYTLTKGDPHTLDVTRGTVMVDFLPVEGQSMRARAAGLDVTVVGTVFYVSVDASGPEVGVLMGAVDVKKPGAEPVRLTDAQRVREDLVAKPIPTLRTVQLSPLVDLDRHRLLLAQLQTPSKAPQDTPQKAIEEATQDPAPSIKAPDIEAPATKPLAISKPARKAIRPRKQAPKAQKKAIEPPKPPKIDDKPAPPAPEKLSLRQQARAALQSGDHTKAAQLYKSALDALSPRSPGAAALRLELARIHTRHLRQPATAARHLRDFLHHHPNDVAAPLARKQLCRLLGARAESDPACQEPTKAPQQP